MADGVRPVSSTNLTQDLSHNSNPERSTLIGKMKSLLKKNDKDNIVNAALGEHATASVKIAGRREMIERVIAFDSKQVLDVMIPRADIISVERETSLTDLLKIFSEAGHSRLPVFRGELDDPIGMVHIRDLVGILADPERHDDQESLTILDQLVRKVLYVPPSMPITDLLLRMQAQRIHMALVIDEYGGTDGLVTIEDLVEEIVGDIQDEHDDDEIAGMKAVSDHCWDANARLPLDEFEQSINYQFDLGDDEVDTLGGLVFTLAGRVPLRGEVIAHEAGFEFEVMDADPRRIRKIRFRKCTDPENICLGEKPTDNA